MLIWFHTNYLLFAYEFVLFLSTTKSPEKLNKKIKIMKNFIFNPHFFKANHMKWESRVKNIWIVFVFEKLLF